VKLSLPAKESNTFKANGKIAKALWYLVLLMILTLIVTFVVIFYLPFLHTNSFGSITSIALPLIAEVVGFILMRKGVLPKPSSEARKISRILLAINVTAVFVIGLLLVFFRAATYQNLIFITIVMTVAFFIVLLLAAFRARTSGRLSI
jgi:quinol-cytochrome oxidoreductase complex cytochrome b subunit